MQHIRLVRMVKPGGKAYVTAQMLLMLTLNSKKALWLVAEVVISGIKLLEVDWYQLLLAKWLIKWQAIMD